MCSIGEMNNCNCSAVYYYCQYTEQLRITLERQEISCRYYTKSTRGKEETVTASMAILKGLSEDGGLFVPTEIPKLDVPMDELAKMSYQETAYEVMKCFLTDLQKKN